MTLPHKPTEEEVGEEDIHTSSDKEVVRRLIKERLGVNIQRRLEQKISKKKKKSKANYKRSSKRIVSGYTRMDTPDFKVSNAKTLHREKNASNVITLTGLKIFPKLVEDDQQDLGTLEVHANGFYYETSSPDSCFSFLYSDVKQAFFRAGDEKTSPLLHIQLHKRIKVGITEKRRKDIQFRLVQTPAGQKRSYNEDLKNFVHNVGEKFRGCCFPFKDAEVQKADEIQGKHLSDAPSLFGLTSFALVQLIDEPFIVIDLLCEIEIVILRLKPDLSKPLEIDMTIVFEDIHRDPVQINSIPIDKLDLIKERCNFAFVEYYVNDCDVDWVSVVKEIADAPPGAFGKIPETLNYYDEYEGFSPEYCGPDGRLDMKYLEED